MITNTGTSLDDQVRSAFERILVSLSGHLEAELAASASDIKRAVSEAQVRAVAEATEHAAAEGRREAQYRLTSLREEFERQREELQSNAASSIAELQQTINEVGGQIGTALREIEEGRKEREDLERQLEDLRRALDESRRGADDALRELEAARRERDQAVHVAEDQQRRVEQARHQLEEAHRQGATLQEHVALASRDSEKAQVEVEGTRRQLDEARAMLAQAERLSSGLDALDRAASLGSVLDELGRLACGESERAAVLLVKGDRLRAWRAIGFDGTEAIARADLPLRDLGFVAEAARSGAALAHRNGDSSSLPLFAAGQGSRHAVALPVEVGGSVIAVLYADTLQSDAARGPRWPSVLEVMVKYAGRVLEAMTVRQAAARWAPRTTGYGRARPSPAAPGRDAR